MDNPDLLSRLRSSDSLIVVEALLSLFDPNRRQVGLSQEVIACICELTRYHIGAGGDEEQQNANETLRNEAIGLLGTHYQVESAFNTLADILFEKRDTNFVLITTISGIFSIGSRHKSKHSEAEKVLAYVALKETFDASVRNAAYIRLLRLAGKIDQRQYLEALTGTASHTPDIPWLESLTFSRNS
jgi:hypothetical protein